MKQPNERKHKKTAVQTCLALIGIIVAVAIGFETYRFIPRHVIKRSFDPKWPTHDLTSGEYSGAYNGLDISYAQGKIRWDELGEVSRLKFIYAKATEGTNIKDPWYDHNVDSARKRHIPIGSYHFLSKAPAALQFENFRSVADKDKQDLLPVIDAEDDGTRGLGKKKIQDLVRTFSRLCKAYYGHTPIIYCSESYYKDYLSPDFDDYYLWIASYDHEPKLPGKPHYDIWQFCRHGRVPGVWNWVDLNKFANGRSVNDILMN